MSFTSCLRDCWKIQILWNCHSRESGNPLCVFAIRLINKLLATPKSGSPLSRRWQIKISELFQQALKSLLENLRICLKQDLQDCQDFLINWFIMVFNLENPANPANPVNLVSDNFFSTLSYAKATCLSSPVWVLKIINPLLLVY